MARQEVKIFLVAKENIAHVRKVPLVYLGEKVLEVGNVSEGEVVLLSPPTTLTDGTKVNVIGLFDPNVDEKPQ